MTEFRANKIYCNTHTIEKGIKRETLHTQEAVERFPHLAHYILNENFAELKVTMGDTTTHLESVEQGAYTRADPTMHCPAQLEERSSALFSLIFDQIARISPAIVASYLQSALSWGDFGDLGKVAGDLKDAADWIEGEPHE